jgi:pimeloyl-ACP methyl ester carboxylesterase
MARAVVLGIPIPRAGGSWLCCRDRRLAVTGTTQFDNVACVRSAVESLLTAGKRVVVLAHSYGGPIASAAITGLSESMLGIIALCTSTYPDGLDQGEAIRNIGGLPFAT